MKVFHRFLLFFTCAIVGLMATLVSSSPIPQDLAAESRNIEDGTSDLARSGQEGEGRHLFGHRYPPYGYPMYGYPGYVPSYGGYGYPPLFGFPGHGYGFGFGAPVYPGFGYGYGGPWLGGGR